MDLRVIQHNPPIITQFPSRRTANFLLFKHRHLSRRRTKKTHLRLFASADPGGGLFGSIRRGSGRFFSKFGDAVKEETGFDFRGLAGRFEELNRFGSETVPRFVAWNKWDNWKDIKNWDPKRFGTLVLYIFVVVFSSQRLYMVVRAPFIERERKEITEAYMEVLILEPTPTNIKKFKKGLWRKTTPKGLKMMKFIEGPDGTLIHDSSYIG